MEDIGIDKDSLVICWVDDLLPPTNSDEARVEELNSTEIDEETKYNIITRTLPSGNFEEFWAMNNLTLEEFIEKKIDLQMEEEKWETMKNGYDKLLVLANFAKLGDKIMDMASVIVEGRMYLCLGGAIATLGEFYVNSFDTWNTLEKMMADIQEDFRKMMVDRPRAGEPWKGHLESGIIVVANWNNEFHRVVIVSVIIPGQLYKVKLLDYGDLVTIPFKEIRHLPRKYLDIMRAQAVRCTIQRYVDFEPGQDENHQYWTLEEGEAFNKLIFDQTLAVRFKRKFLTDGETTWEVNIHLYDIDTQKIIKFHLEREIMKQFGKKIPKFQLKDETDSNPKASISRFFRT